MEYDLTSPLDARKEVSLWLDDKAKDLDIL